MKLTLSQALRRALFAGAFFCWVPAAWSVSQHWYWWSGDVCYIVDNTPEISTSDADGDVYFHSGTSNDFSNPNPTVTTLTITSPICVSIGGKYPDERMIFENLTIRNIVLETTDWAGYDYAILKVANGYTATLGNIKGTDSAPLSSIGESLHFDVEGTLRLTADYFAENAEAFSVDGGRNSGVVELTGGIIDFTSLSTFTEGTYKNPIYWFNYGAVLCSNTIADGATVGAKMNIGYHGTLANDENGVVTLTVQKVDATRVTDGTPQPIWHLTGDASMDSLLAGDCYIDQNTGEYAAYTRAEGLLFYENSSLSYSGEASITIGGAVSAEMGAAVTLRPNNSTLVLEQGEGALNQNNAGAGLVIDGNGGVVILHGVSTIAPESIALSNGNTLEINGPASLILDSARNSFGTTSSLRKGDGGTLTYIGGVANRLATLSNAAGTLRVQKALYASDILAHELVLGGEDDQLSADTIHVDSILLGSNSMLTADSISALTGASLLSVSVEQGATLTMEDELKVTTLSIGYATDGTGKSGLVSNGPVSLSAHPAAAASGTACVMSDLSLDSTRLSSSASRNIQLNIAQPSPETVEVSLGSAFNTLVNSTQELLLHDSVLTGNSHVALTGANLHLRRTQHDATSNISALGAGVSISFEDVSLASGSCITIGADAGSASNYTISENGSTAIMLSGTATSEGLYLSHLTLYTQQSNGTYLLDSPGTYTLMESVDGAISIDNVTEHLITAPGLTGTLWVDATNGKLLVDLVDSTTETINSLITTNSSRIVADILLERAPAAQGVMKELFDYMRNTSVASEESRRQALSALSSNSVTMLADSQRRGVTGHINRLRNRIIQMGNEQGIEPETHIHAWIEADGDYYSVENDGEASGYEYQSWGGTVGVHADVGNFSFGAAVSAAYGDLTGKGADLAEGDQDSCHFSLFARHQQGSWVQMGIISVGLNKMELERHIHTITAEGDASGYTVSAAYETGYTFALNEEASRVIMPFANVMLTSAHMGQYNEDGAIGNAALNNNGDDYIYGTASMGARYQAIIGRDVNERVAFIEARAKVVADFGDDTHESAVYFTGAPHDGFSLRGAESGRIGVQIGAGISVPIGLYKTLFADVDADFRDGATGVSGSMGIRIEL